MCKTKIKKNPVTDWMNQIESKCMDKVPVKDDRITYIECGRNPGSYCKFQNCPLKDAKNTRSRGL